MMAYLDEVKAMSIKDFKIRQILGEENKKVDALANLALAFDFISVRSVPLEFLPNPSIDITKAIYQAVIVSDNANQFDNDGFKLFCLDLANSNYFFSPGHPQANVQVKVTNKTILRNLKARIESVILVEIGVPSFRTLNFDKENNKAELRLNLDLLAEKWEQAEVRHATYKHQVAKYYNQRVKLKSFLLGNLVLNKVTLSMKEPNAGKLGLTWEGPYRVIKVSYIHSVVSIWHSPPFTPKSSDTPSTLGSPMITLSSSRTTLNSPSIKGCSSFTIKG
ncbi:hypothetical protein Acr_00g0074500 [Actinidia rufa]|uniref:Uncharacterized protein n=1 Tax=Actinidia rufa TaxID=165716 RepID=A0A7J0DSE8_9ERIC|nr:hypothetical protein Acr_00g0074500 [Actinidia rufa]